MGGRWGYVVGWRWKDDGRDIGSSWRWDDGSGGLIYVFIPGDDSGVAVAEVQAGGASHHGHTRWRGAATAGRPLTTQTRESRTETAPSLAEFR